MLLPRGPRALHATPYTEAARAKDADALKAATNYSLHLPRSKGPDLGVFLCLTRNALDEVVRKIHAGALKVAAKYSLHLPHSKWPEPGVFL